jgi:hypothetical protein
LLAGFGTAWAKGERLILQRCGRGLCDDQAEEKINTAKSRLLFGRVALGNSQ